MQAYGEQVRGLLDGGVDLALVETIFDTLNAKAAFFAIQRLLAEGAARRRPWPRHLHIQSGATVGFRQTVEGFWNSISHVPLLSVGMNCALGPAETRPLIKEFPADAPISERAAIRMLDCPIPYRLL